MSREIAKFLCGFETFHALFHSYLFFTGTPFSQFGIVATPTINLSATVLNLVIALALGLYAWKRPAPMQRREA